MDYCLDTRNQIMAILVANEGDWDSTLSDINDKKEITSEFVEKCLSLNSKFITILDQEYPAYLKSSYKAPFVLFYEGEKGFIESDKLLAVLNDKTASQYANESICSLCDSLVKNCIFVLPFGHVKQNELIRRIISKSGRVIAVLNKPLGVEYQTDKELYNELANNHLIVTSIPKSLDNSVKESPIQCYKLVATLANRILIGAISKTSPETVAVAIALQMNGDVFCIPFLMGSKYIGNSLIHDGAVLVENSDTLLYEGKFE